MNKSQKRAALVGLGVIALMILYPPWTYSYFAPGRDPSLPPGTIGLGVVKRQACTYAPLFRPPALWEVHLNVRRLAFQCGLVGAITVWAVHRRRFSSAEPDSKPYTTP